MQLRRMFKYRIYPTKAQITALQLQLDCCRWVYNKTLETRKTIWDEKHKFANLYDTSKMLTKWKEEEVWLRQGHAQALQNAQDRVDRAFRRFFQRVKQGEKPGYPRFRNAERYDSYTYPQDNGAWSKMSRNIVRLPKIGSVKVKLHRPLAGKAKTLTVFRTALGEWYIVVCCVIEKKLLPQTDKVAGVDVGLSHFATLSDGTQIDNPRFLKRDLDVLAIANKKLTASEKGTAKHNKHRRVVQHIYQRITDRRCNFAHQASRMLVNEYQVLAFEKLVIKKLQHGNFLTIRRGIHDVAWYRFAQNCLSKAEEAGRTVVFVNPRGTTQICSSCGVIVAKNLDVRRHDCPHCGLNLDRDHNAALNILARGLASLAEKPKSLCLDKGVVTSSMISLGGT